jgi:hypothetical protein
MDNALGGIDLHLFLELGHDVDGHTARITEMDHIIMGLLRRWIV